ncbi:Tetratricopeptide repeat-containing protein [Chryseobacterium arachidis]|uniref:Tetratricopeptide repeat-containing protein n=1 Tax=Chryseobacterium arachidis TaxID=1416778 RepID=A0A1M5GJN9_9FLAO|nr:helix-turn-helix domain-containing protein [Chryseobacterium arachidis]SHG03939.1 Tetratricopeptide repeat-containing protein [Chryseobacterium arachidis]
MIKNFYLLFLFIFAISCSDPAKKQKLAEENFQKKKIAKLDYLEFSGNPELIITTAQESKQLAKKINYSYGIFKCNMSLIFAYNAIGKYKEATLVGKENDALVNKIEANYIVCLNYTNVASAYSYLGLLDEAENYLNKALIYNQKLKDSNDKYYSLGTIYSGFAFVETMKGESSPNLNNVQKSYLKQLWALQQVKANDRKTEQKKSAQLAFVYLNLGITSDELKNPLDAANYFYKALDICKRYQFTNNTPLLVHTSMANLLLDQKKYDSCRLYAQKAIILEKTSPFPEVRRDLFQILYKSSLAKNNQQDAEKYTNLYMKLNDSLTNAEKRAINTPVKLIVEKKEKEKNNTVKNVIIISAIISFVLLLCGWLFWRRKNRKLQESYEKLIEKSKSDNQNTETVIINGVQNDSVNLLLEKLSKFEKSKNYIQHQIKLTDLASELGIQPEYLAETIQKYKKKTFSDYISSLKINHVVHLLYSAPNSRVYREDYLAKSNGFSSKAEFIHAFKKTTGIPFSYFIKKLERDSQ